MEVPQDYQSERSIKVQGINKTIEHEDPSVIDTQSFNADLSDIFTIHPFIKMAFQESLVNS